MAWLTAIVELVELVPSAVSLLQQIVAVIKAHPAGPAAGVVAVSDHMEKMKLDSSNVGVGSDLKQ